MNYDYSRDAYRHIGIPTAVGNSYILRSHRHMVMTKGKARHRVEAHTHTMTHDEDDYV